MTPLPLAPIKLEAGDAEAQQAAAIAEARKEAILSIRALVIQELRATGLAELDGRVVEIADAQGKVLELVHFRDALSLG